MQEKFIPKKKKIVRIKSVVNEEFKNFKRAIEEKLIKNPYLIKWGVTLNEKRVGEKVVTIRKDNNFDLQYHLLHQDVTGATNGCGCVYCKIHRQHVRYRAMYRHLKRKYDKLVYLKTVPEKAIDNNIPASFLHTDSIEKYRSAMETSKEWLFRFKTTEKKLAKSLKIPNV